MNLRRSISCFSKLAAAGAIGEHVALGAAGRHAQAKALYLVVPEDRARRQPRLRPPSAWSVSPCRCSPFPSTKSAPAHAKLAACEGIINESEGKVLTGGRCPGRLWERRSDEHARRCSARQPRFLERAGNLGSSQSLATFMQLIGVGCPRG
jgi:hypothetical protein